MHRLFAGTRNCFFRFVKYLFVLTILFHIKSRSDDAASTNTKSRIALCERFHLMIHPFNHKNHKNQKNHSSDKK